MIIFTHIARTSGSAIQSIVSQQQNVTLKKKAHRNPRKFLSDKEENIVAIGHFAYGVHKYAKDDISLSYFTLLREPMSRWISHFTSAMGKVRRNGHVLRQIWKKTGKDLKNFLEYCIDKEINCNIMTKQLCGIESIYKSQDPMFMFLWSPRHQQTSKTELANYLSVAKDNLLTKYDFVGFQEAGSLSHVCLCKKYNWTYIEHPYIPRAPDIRLDWNDAEVREILYRMNEYDIKLYDFAVENLWKKNLVKES